jgi:ferritin-like metal-binding protein YciE
MSTFEDLYISQLRELYSAETQSIPALKMLSENADDAVLAQIFREHCAETADHAQRLEQLLARLNQGVEGGDCETIGALIQEVERAAGEDGSAAMHDMALTFAAQQIEHYEMACYGSLHTYASVLGHESAAAELQEILDQETDADQRLTEVAERLNAAIRAEMAAFGVS